MYLVSHTSHMQRANILTCYLVEIYQLEANWVEEKSIHIKVKFGIGRARTTRFTKPIRVYF